VERKPLIQFEVEEEEKEAAKAVAKKLGLKTLAALARTALFEKMEKAA
jgi:antitoxin component of RelBE/YafQ-DinJ toxin-antitoxin module